MGRVYLDFKDEVDFDDLKKMLKRDKKIIDQLSLENVQKGWSKKYAAFWQKIFKMAPKVEEIEIGMDGNFRDLPYILSNLKVFKKLKILNVFIKVQEMEVKEKKSVIQDAAIAMIQELPKELKASVKEVLATFDSKEKVTIEDDPEGPENPDLKYIQHKVLILFEKEAKKEVPQFVQLGHHLLAFRNANSKFVTYLDFESEIDWVDLENMWKRDPKDPREKKIIKRLSLDNVQKSKTSSAFWKKVFNLAPKVEEIEIGMNGNFRDLPYILSDLNVFKQLKLLNVFIKTQEMEVEGKKRIIQDAANTMKHELPKELEASVKEILASFNSKEKFTDPEIPKSPDLKQKRHKVVILLDKEANEDPQFVQLGDYYEVVIKRKNLPRSAKSKKTDENDDEVCRHPYRSVTNVQVSTLVCSDEDGEVSFKKEITPKSD